jgi:hypothetical protein
MSMTTSWRPPEREPQAQGGPARGQASATLRAALEDVSPPDDEFSQHLAAAVALLRSGLAGPRAEDPTAGRPGRHVGPSFT